MSASNKGTIEELRATIGAQQALLRMTLRGHAGEAGAVRQPAAAAPQRQQGAAGQPEQPDRRLGHRSYLKQLATIGVLREHKVGREKLFLHPAFTDLPQRD